MSSAAEWVLAKSLKVWPDNPRKNGGAVLPVAKSLIRFGWGRPIVARVEDREIVVGHTALRAAAELKRLSKDGVDGWHEDALKTLRGSVVPVRFVNLSVEEAHQLAIADNRLGEISDWSEDLTKLLDSMTPFDRDLVGFSESDFKVLMDQELHLDDSSIVTGLPDPSSEVDVKHGDVFDLGPHVLWCADTLDPKLREAVSSVGFQIAVIDPPFEMGASVVKLLVSDPCVVFGQACHVRAIPDALWRFERVIDKVTSHRSATTKIGHRHAFVVQVGSRRVIPRTRDTYPSVVTCEDRPNHPHEKSVSLLVEHLTHWAPPWETVVDWFAGSGTTLAAANLLGKRSLLVERSPIYCDVILRRWEAISGEPASRRDARRSPA